MNCISAIRPMAADLALNHGLEKNVAASSGVVQHFRPEDAISCNDGNVVGRHTVIDDAAPLVVPRVDTAATEFEGLFRNLRPPLRLSSCARTFRRSAAGRVLPSANWR